MGGCGFSLGPFGWFWVWVLGVCGLLGDLQGFTHSIGNLSRNSYTISHSFSAANTAFCSAQAVSVTFTILLYYWIAHGLRTRWPSLDFWIRLSAQDSITLDYNSNWVFIVVRLKISAFYVAFFVVGLLSLLIHWFFYTLFSRRQRA